ncbi:MAG: dihydrofolate reductase family protein [Acidimicrobiia bacterium]|nr:dihydrofolate reductase family protein [Acidimicrobiia bacterium]
MIALYPRGSEEPFDALEAVAAEDRTPRTSRPWVLANMIASADGATAIEGVSGPLGGPADLEMFTALRAVCDAILVGASTVREEDYRPPSGGPAEARAARSARGQATRPQLVVVTASLSLDVDQRLFADPEYRPIIATVAAAPSERRRALEDVAEVIECGTDQVDLGRVIDELGHRGARTVLAEGGPSLNAQLIADDLIDEWNLTVSPILAAGSSRRPAHGPQVPHPVAPMSLSRVWQADELLFCRWVRA